MARKRFFNYFKNKKWLQDVTFDNKKIDTSQSFHPEHISIRKHFNPKISGVHIFSFLQTFVND